MKITPDQARMIADEFMDAASVIDDYLDANYKNIAREEYEYLNESFKTLMRMSSFATTMAVDLSIEEMEEPGKELLGVIKTTKEKIKTLKKIGHMIRVTSGLVDMAGAIAAKDPGAIFKSAKNLRKTLKEEPA